MKIKYREVLDRLQNFTEMKITHADLSRVLIDAGINVTANALSSRLSSDGYLKDEELRAIEIAYGQAETMLQSCEKTEDADCVRIRVLSDVEASMGYGAVVYNETQTATYSVSRQLVKELGVSPDSSEIIYGRGNSMEPTILGGDALLVDRSKLEISDGRIYCIRYEGQLLVKRLQKISKSKIKIISDNKDYEPVSIDFVSEPIDFEIIGEVRWSGRVFR